MDDGRSALDRLSSDRSLAQVAADDLGSPSSQLIRGRSISHDHSYPLALRQQPGDEAATQTSGGSTHKRGHRELLQKKSLAGKQ
jgi:hypothetical protein